MAVSAIGKVLKIYPHSTGCYIKLDYNGVKPKSSYFRLNNSHPNYNSLYTLALTAAVNRYLLTIRTTADIVPTAFGDVQYMHVVW